MSPGSFLALPTTSSLGYFPYVLAAEIAWRGYLQPRFVRRNGIVRGIFLVGVVWRTFHYIWDFNPSMTVRDVCVGLLWHLLVTVCLSYLLAWLTVGSDSILPAALAHAGYDVYLTARSLPIHNPQWLTLLLRVDAVYALFHFFPPASLSTVAESHMPSSSEPQPFEV